MFLLLSSNTFRHKLDGGHLSVASPTFGSFVQNLPVFSLCNNYGEMAGHFKIVSFHVSNIQDENGNVYHRLCD